MREQMEFGLDGAAGRLNWDDYEALNGRSLTESMGRLKAMDREALPTAATIDTVKRRMPADVATKALDDPALLGRVEEEFGLFRPVPLLAPLRRLLPSPFLVRCRQERWVGWDGVA